MPNPMLNQWPTSGLGSTLTVQQWPPQQTQNQTQAVIMRPLSEAASRAHGGGPVFVRQRNKGILCKQHLATPIAPSLPLAGGAGSSSTCHPTTVCSRGFDCPYLHATPNQPRPLPDSVCNFFLNSVCLKDNCRFFHGRIERLQQLKAAGATHYRLEDEMTILDPPPALPAEVVFAGGLKKPVPQQPPIQHQQHHVFFPMLVSNDASPPGTTSSVPPTGAITNDLQQTNEQRRTQKWVDDQEGVRNSSLPDNPSGLANGSNSSSNSTSSREGVVTYATEPTSILSGASAADCQTLRKRAHDIPIESSSSSLPALPSTTGGITSSDDVGTSTESPFDIKSMSPSATRPRSLGDPTPSSESPVTNAVHRRACESDSSPSKRPSSATATRGSEDDASNSTPLDFSSGHIPPLQQHTKHTNLARLVPTSSDGAVTCSQSERCLINEHENSRAVPSSNDLLIRVEASPSLQSLHDVPSDPVADPHRSSAVPKCEPLYPLQVCQGAQSAGSWTPEARARAVHCSVAMPTAGNPSNYIAIPNGPMFYASDPSAGMVAPSSHPMPFAERPFSSGAPPNTLSSNHGWNPQAMFSSALPPMTSLPLQPPPQHTNSSTDSLSILLQQQQQQYASMQRVLLEQQRLIQMQQQQLSMQHQLRHQQPPSANDVHQSATSSSSMYATPQWVPQATSSNTAVLPSVAFSHSAYSGVSPSCASTMATGGSLYPPQAPVGHLSNHEYHHAAHMPMLTPFHNNNNMLLQQQQQQQEVLHHYASPSLSSAAVNTSSQPQPQVALMPFPPLSSVAPSSVASTSAAQQPLFVAPHHHHYHATLPLYQSF